MPEKIVAPRPMRWEAGLDAVTGQGLGRRSVGLGDWLMRLCGAHRSTRGDGRGMMRFQDYYRVPGVREVCHAVKQGEDEGLRDEAIARIATYMLSFGVVRDSSVLIPAPQHGGRAEYTLRIAEAVARETGARVLDIIGCEPHRPLYEQKLAGAREPDLRLHLTEEAPSPAEADGWNDGEWFLVDNVISTGRTLGTASDFIGKRYGRVI